MTGGLITKRWRLPALASLTVLLLLAAGLSIIFQGERDYHERRENAARSHAEILAASVTAALDFGDVATAQEYVNALKVSRQILAARVYDARGRLFAGFVRTGTPSGPVRTTDAFGASVAQVNVPVIRSGTKIGTVNITTAIEPLSRRVSRYAMIALLVGMTSLVLAVMSYAQTALRRVNRTLAKANADLQFQMEERARTEEQLREAQKMQSLGKITGGVAHDFNNLLAVIQGSAELLQRPTLSEERRMRYTQAIIDASAQGASLTAQMLAFARRQPLKPEVLDLNKAIGKMLVMLQPLLGANISLTTDIEPRLDPVEVDPGQFETALLNIIVNARDAMPDGGEVIIRSRNASFEDGTFDGGAVVISVEDSGTGIPPDQLDLVFEPFFTTKTVGKGTGLGLSQVYGFTAQSGGKVRIESELGKGTVLTMLLPVSGKPLPVDQDGHRPVAGRKAAGRVLLVEDNEEVGNLAEAIFEELGHGVVRARSGVEALKIADEGALFDLVFSDVVMPGMSGLELAGELQQRRPNIPIILTTGYSDRITVAGSEGFPVVHKPYGVQTLQSAVDKALAIARS